MSDHLHSLDAADSGFLNAFVGPQRVHTGQRGVQSRVGADEPRVDVDRPSAECPDLNRLLRDVPLPDGLQNRLIRIAESD